MPLQATKKNSAKLNVMNTEISVVVGSDEVIFTNLRKKQTKTKRKTKRKSSYWAVQLKLSIFRCWGKIHITQEIQFLFAVNSEVGKEVWRWIWITAKTRQVLKKKFKKNRQTVCFSKFLSSRF